MARYRIDFRVVETIVTHRSIEMDADDETHAKMLRHKLGVEAGNVVRVLEDSDVYLTKITKLEEV